MQERVLLGGLCFRGQLFGGESKGSLDVLVDEAVDGSEALPEAGLGDEDVGLAGTDDEGLDALDLIEGCGKGVVWGPLVLPIRLGFV